VHGLDGLVVCCVAQVTVQYNGQYDLQSYTARLTSGEIVVSFRGSDNLENWIEDLKSLELVAYSKCDGCEVGDGFLQSWEALSDSVLASVQSLGDTSTPVLITGHSLGAALAALAAIDIQAAGYTLSGASYTFGQPRVGNEAFASWFDQQIPAGSWYRLVHYADIVPHLPPEALDFYHVMTEVWYNEAQTSYQVCTASGEDPSCSDSLLLPISIDDHLDYLNYMISRSCGTGAPAAKSNLRHPSP
jgi:Lipase (class 3)